MGEQRIIDGMQENKLSREQYIEAERLMSSRMDGFPVELQDMLVAVSHRIGLSGEVIWTCVCAYVKGQTYDEYIRSFAVDDAATPTEPTP